VIRAYFS